MCGMTVSAAPESTVKGDSAIQVSSPASARLRWGCTQWLITVQLPVLTIASSFSHAALPDVLGPLKRRARRCCRRPQRPVEDGGWLHN